MIRLATVFSGIGAIEQALKKNKEKYEIVFACDNGEREITLSKHDEEEIINQPNNLLRNSMIKEFYDATGKRNFVKDSYFANYAITNDRWFEDIRFIDGKEFKGRVDLFVGGSPCQSFSIIGKRGGLDDARGTLFYDYARLIKEIEPKVFIYENVVGMLNHDHGRTWNIIKEIFLSLGYDVHYDILNAKNYGIPQDRKRLFVVGFKYPKEFKFPKKIELESTMFDYLENPPIQAKYYLGKKGFEFVTSTKNRNRARVNREIIQTQKANQQFNWNGDFVFENEQLVINNADIMKRAYVGEWNNQRGVVRQLTNRECLRLMGFDDSFEIAVDSTNAYRQAGNSIVVNVLQAILKSIKDVEKFDEE